MDPAASEERDRLDDLIEAAEKDVVQIKRDRKPVAAVTSWETYESLMETLEIVSDPESLAKFQEGVRDMEAGRVKSWDDVKRHRETHKTAQESTSSM